MSQRKFTSKLPLSITRDFHLTFMRVNWNESCRNLKVSSFLTVMYSMYHFLWQRFPSAFLYIQNISQRPSMCIRQEINLIWWQKFHCEWQWSGKKNGGLITKKLINYSLLSTNVSLLTFVKIDKILPRL